MTDSKLTKRGKDGWLIGLNPLEIDVNDLADAGHKQQPLAKAIRQNCLDCMGGSPGEVRKCAAIQCAMWPYRMGKNPFQASKCK